MNIIKWLVETIISILSLLIETMCKLRDYDKPSSRRNRKNEKYCSPRRIKVGISDLINDEGCKTQYIEGYHSYSYIEDHIFNDENNTLIIGSPHLKYWFETEDDPRLLKILDSKVIKISVNLYKCDSEEVDEKIKHNLEFCKSKYGSKFSYHIINEPTSISYIFYNFKIKRKLYSRCLVGFQKTKYRERPFLEFVSEADSECSFVKSILTSHKS